MDGYCHIEGDGQRTYSTMVGAMDDCASGVPAKLRGQVLEQNKLTVVLSDNGRSGYVAERCSAGPLRGNKRYHRDG